MPHPFSSVLERRRAQPAPAPAPGGFDPVPHRRASTRLVRGLALAALALVVLIGSLDLVGRVGHLFTTPPPPPHHVTQLDLADAAATAVGFTADYFTYDSEHTDTRATALTRWTGATTTAAPAWTGPGKLTTDLVTAGATLRSGPDTAIVQTLARVTPADHAARWLSLDVVLTRTGHTLRVQRAALAGDPPTPALTPPGSQVDAQLTNALTNLPRDLFGALASGQLGYITTPTVQLTGLTGAVDLEDVTSWKVYASASPTDVTRHATAEVVWQLADTGLQITQSYTLEITRTDGRWLLASYTPTLKD